MAAAGGGWQQGERAVEAATAGWLWLGFISLFSILELHTYTLVFFSARAGIATKTRVGREGQTAYYVECKALHCGARKATLLTLCNTNEFVQSHFSDGFLNCTVSIY